MRVFWKAWLESRSGAAATDASLYDQASLTKATADRATQVSRCAAQAKEFQNEAAHIACLTAAYRAFDAAIALKDRGVTDALAASLASAAADADAGQLTPGQARTVYDMLTAFYDGLFAEISAIQDARIQGRLAASYADRFEKAYREAGPMAVAAGQPPLDDQAEAHALDTATKARKDCASQSRDAPKRNYADCVSNAEKQFARTVKLRDGALNLALDATLRAAAADPDTQSLPLAQFAAMTDAIIGTYIYRIDEQQTDYHAIADRPVAEAYVIRFGASYILVAGRSLDFVHAPYDKQAWERAVREQSEALSACANQRNEAATEVANLQCWIAGYRTFAATIKARDQHLLETFLSTMHQIAADTDAGRLTRWQARVVYEAVLQAYGNAYFRAENWYEAHQYQPVVLPYVVKFDNDVISAVGEKGDADGPPWDIDAGIIAEKAYGRSIRSCFDRRSDLKTHVAFWDCRAAAEQARADAGHARDIQVREKLVAITHQAAADADAGNITSDELDAVAAGLTIAYDALLREAWRAWRVKQQALGSPR